MLAPDRLDECGANCVVSVVDGFVVGCLLLVLLRCASHRHHRVRVSLFSLSLSLFLSLSRAWDSPAGHHRPGALLASD